MAELPLPVIDLSPLSLAPGGQASMELLAEQLGKAFETVGFVYLTDVPLTFSHDHVLDMAKSFFQIPYAEKFRLAKKSFKRSNKNTYRGYFPAQSGSDNFKEGYEVGPPVSPIAPGWEKGKINLAEPNVWPSEASALGFRKDTEQLYTELQDLSSRLLSLLAIALGKELSYFDHYLRGSVSTLRYLHYPAIFESSPQQNLCCTPHTDSGILTLLHQDSTGGLEVLNPDGRWVDAPYVPGSLVVNIGDLMARVSGGRFRATRHRVRSSPGKERYSVPFFFEPGVDCTIQSVDADGAVIVYGEHVLVKMKGWVEFQDLDKSSAVA